MPKNQNQTPLSDRPTLEDLGDAAFTASLHESVAEQMRNAADMVDEIMPPVGRKEKVEKAIFGSGTSPARSVGSASTFAQVDEELAQADDNTAQQHFAGVIDAAVDPWHPLFFKRPIRVSEFTPVESLIVGGGIRVPEGEHTRSIMYDRMTTLLGSFHQDFPESFTRQFAQFFLECFISDLASMNRLGIRPEVYMGYVVARVMKQAPVDYDSTMDAFYTGVSTRGVVATKSQHLYMAYYMTKHAMDAFRKTTIQSILRHKRNQPITQEELKEGIISSLWRLPKSADALLSIFIAFPREILQGEDETWIEEAWKQEFLDDFLVSCRRFTGLYNDVLAPWGKVSMTKKHPMRQWNNISMIVRNIARLERYYQGEHKHPLKNFLKKIARTILGRDVAEQQMFAGWMVPGLTEAVTDATNLIGETRESVTSSTTALNEFLTEATKRSVHVGGVAETAQVTLVQTGMAAAQAQSSLQSIEQLTKRANEVLEQLLPPDGTGPDKLKANLAQGVKKGVDSSNLGTAIKFMMGSGKDLLAGFQKVAEVVGVLLPYILTPIFIWTSYHAFNSSTGRLFNGAIALLSGVYLLAKHTSLVMGAGIFGSIIRSLQQFWSTPHGTEYSDVGDEGIIADQESFTDMPLSVWSTLAVAFTSFGFSKADSKVEMFSRTFKDVQSSGRGLEALLNAAMTFITSFSDDVKGWMGIETKTSNPQLLSFVDEITTFSAQFKSGVAPPSKFMLDKAIELYATGTVYAAAFKKAQKLAEEAVVQRQLRTLEVITAEIKKIMVVPVKPRAMPVSVVFQGQPGCGKTIFTRFLERLMFKYELSKMDPEVAKVLMQIYNTNPLSLCYHKGQDFYWDAIAPSTMIVTLDDWLQRTAVVGGDYAPLMDFIGMANTEPWSPRMAFSKEEKWIAPSFVFASTNAKRLHDETIKDVDAVYRRIDYLVDVRLDKAKIKDGKFSLEAYEFALMEWIPNWSMHPEKGVAKEKVVIGAKELISLIVRTRVEKLKGQQVMDDTMGTIVDEIITNEMDILKADIFIDIEPIANQEMADEELESVDLGDRPDSPPLLREPAQNMAFPVLPPYQMPPMVFEPAPRSSIIRIPNLGPPAEEDRIYREMFGNGRASREHLRLPPLDDAFLDVMAANRADDDAIAPVQEPDAAVRVVRQELYNRHGLLASLDAVSAQMSEAGLDPARVDASKLEKKISSFSLDKLGLKVKAAFDWTTEIAEKIRAGFVSLGEGIYSALITLKDFLYEHRVILLTAVGVIATAVTSIMGLQWLMKEPSAFGESASTFAHVKAMKQTRRTGPGHKAHAKPEMGSDRFDAVRAKLRGNMYDVYGPDIEGNLGKYMGVINGVCDRIFHAPYHFLLKNEAMWNAAGLPAEKRKWFLRQGDTIHVVPYENVYLCGDAETAYAQDRAIFGITATVGNTLPMCSNVITHYISDVEIGQARYRHNAEFPVCLFNRDHMVDEASACFITSKRANCVHGSQGDTILTEEYDVRDLFKYRIATKAGDCGSLLMAIDGTTPRVVGAHVLGAVRTGFAYRITSDDIKKAIYGVIKEAPNVLEVPDYKIMIGDSDPRIVSQASAYDLNVHTCISDLSIRPKGSVFTSSYLTRYLGNGTDYVEFNQDVTNTAPEAYARAREPYCARIEESQGKQKDFMPMLKACAQAVTDDLKKLRWDRSHRLYQYKEAVLGIPGTNFKAIDFGTSSGYPWMNMGITKKKIGRYVDNKFEHGSAYVELYPVVEKICQQLAQDEVPEMTYLDTLKVEWRDRAKANTPRLVSAAPIDAVLTGRMLFGSFMHFMCDMGLDAETLIGFNPYKEGDTFAARFLQFGEILNCACADYKGFDTDHTPEMISLCATIINGVMGGTEPEQRARETYIWSIANSKHVRGEIMEVWYGSMPSGNVLTAILNCLINMMLVRFIWLKANKYELSCLPKFRNHVVFACLGDDNGVAVDPQYTEFFTEKAQSDAVALLGYRMTSATKGAELRTEMTRFTEMEILKRVPRFDVGRSRWVLPLRLSVVLYMPMKTKRNDYLTIAKDNLETALHELSLHDPQLWEEWSPKMIHFCSDDFRPTSTQRGYYLDRVLEEGYYDLGLFEDFDSE